MPDTYTPVLRNHQNEREVIQYFGGFAHFDENDKRILNLEPIIEICEEDDLNHLAPFEDASDRIFIDLPIYQTRRDTDFGNKIRATLESYGGRGQFFLDNKKLVDFPVVSGRVEPPVDYAIHQELQSALQGSFKSITHRLMVRMRGQFSQQQRQTLNSLSNAMRQSDRVVFDVVDDGINDDLMDDLEFLVSTFSSYERTVMNIFNPFNAQPNNRSPVIADELGMTGFGDFAINVRYPGGGGRGDTVTIRHYYPNRAFVEEFEGVSYEEASNELRNWTEWNSDHCDYCRDADRLTTGNPSTWKRIRMGHYITSVLREQI